MNQHAYSFHPQFVMPLLHGLKLQTIRRRHDDEPAPLPGDTARLYADGDDGRAELLLSVIITQVRPVAIRTRSRTITLDGELLSLLRAHDFAQADGFDNRDALLAYIAKVYGDMEFSGWCINWDEP